MEETNNENTLAYYNKQLITVVKVLQHRPQARSLPLEWSPGEGSSWVGSSLPHNY
jgi:hypothetical protein